jgi:hypothetical protein
MTRPVAALLEATPEPATIVSARAIPRPQTAFGRASPNLTQVHTSASKLNGSPTYASAAHENGLGAICYEM